MIPFNRVDVTGNELEYVREAIRGGHVSGDGPFTKRCQRLLEELLGAPRVLLTTSCTHALEMAAILLGIEPGDEVVLPSFTFVSTANAFVLRGARPVFVDVRPDTLNMDERLLARAVGPRTKAVVPVHYAGVACDMEPILRAARESGAAVVEDAAHALLGRWRGRLLGTFGRLATLSFHETKNVACGEGGALVLNDPELVARAEVLREKGTDRSRFFRGEVDRYTWVDVGSSFAPSDMLAGFLLGQLEQAEVIQERRRRLFERYLAGLSVWAARHAVALPTIPDGADPAWHLFYLLLPSAQARPRLIAWLRERGILAVFHYVPLHLSPMGRRLGYAEGACPVTEDVSDRLLRLPLFFGLDQADQDRVIEAVVSFSP